MEDETGQNEAVDDNITQQKQPVDSTKVAADARTTAVLSTKQIKRHLHPAKSITSDIPSKGEREIIMVIRGIIERFIIPSDRKITLGRADAKMRTIPDIDLTPYGALDRGVSRVHAHLWIENEQIYISDADSTNGTYLDGDRLEPKQPKILSRGDELLLGRLAVQILFR